MNIKGHGEVSAIRLTHKGCQLNFENILPSVYMDNMVFEPSTIAFFEFKDTLEVDMMIAMLTKFKEECGNTWKWRRT